MRWRTVPILIATLASTPAHADDLRGYDKLGPINVGFGGHRAFRPVEQFIASHWNRRHRGYVIFKGQSIEGQGTTVQLFIEPAAGSDWHIRGISQGQRSNRPNPGVREFKDEFEATGIKWRTDRGITVLELTDRLGNTVMTLN